MKNLWLSIQPRWIDEIMSGQKSAELRRRAPNVDAGSMAILYSTSPFSEVVGHATVERVVEVPLESLWSKYAKVAAVTRDEFDDYFEGVVIGTAIELSNVTQLPTPIGLSSLRAAGIQPAQGWRYLQGDLADELLEMGQLIPTP